MNIIVHTLLRIFRYEVFKLRNVNDCYMVASGVPLAVGKKLGNTHAAQIATLALDILVQSASFVIPHKPKEKLLLRDYYLVKELQLWEGNFAMVIWY